MDDKLIVGLTRATMVAQPLPMLSPGMRATTQDKELIDLLNLMRVDFNKLLDEKAQDYIRANVTYVAGDVLDVDLSYLGRKKRYYKGTTRFLIRAIEPFFWSDSYSGRYTRLWVNLHGLYLAPDGAVLLPPTTPCGMATELDPGSVPMERIGLNVSGDNATILGLSADQNHKWDVFQAMMDAAEAKEIGKSDV